MYKGTLSITSLLLLSLVFYGCWGDNAEVKCPDPRIPNISELAITDDLESEPGTLIVVLSFTFCDEDGDLNGGYMDWTVTVGGDETPQSPVSLEGFSNSGIYNYSIYGLSWGTEYTFSLFFVDAAGNQSNVLTGTHTTSSNPAQ